MRRNAPGLPPLSTRSSVCVAPFGGTETSDTCQPALAKSPSWNTTPGADDTASRLSA